MYGFFAIRKTSYFKRGRTGPAFTCNEEALTKLVISIHGRQQARDENASTQTHSL